MDSTQELEALKNQMATLAERIGELEANERRSRSLSRGEVDSHFERLLREIDRRSLERIIREYRPEEWGAAIVGLPVSMVAKVRDCVSVNAWKLVKDAAKTDRGGYYQRDKILTTVRQLEEMGEIVLSREASQIDHEVAELVPSIWTAEEMEAEMAIAAREREAKSQWFAEALAAVDLIPRQKAKDEEGQVAV